ncbi:DUF1097 domain-containing protein [Poseidonocella sedimentorum]|uniref:Uncharacterized conserved protein n=1 Tax=Poseidonocella sedimentorum TaxID=871652 RepID=A0A1I6DNG2_9RHOB|nr:DUF1097 domain-containing protein [Poseidonocella sedimentorum]SFR06907.1 Uncharacterized conserved protein [Poseidonocella sedimentorum]
MDLIIALAIVIGVMGGLATWGAVAMASPYVLIWVIFIAWASYFHCGGKTEGLKSSTLANIWGAIMAAVALIVLTSMGVTAVNAGICVGATVLIMILGAKVSILSAIPAQVYGYAATAGLFLLGGAAYGEGSGGIIQVAIAVSISMIIGNVFGYISEQIAGSLVGMGKAKYQGGCAHVVVSSNAEPIDNHQCHCNVCKNVTGQLTTHVAFFKHGDLKCSNEGNLDRVPFNADNPDGPLELCLCKDCGTPIMLDDKQKRIRVAVPNVMGYDNASFPAATYHAFYDASKGYKQPDDGRPVHEGLRPEFSWPSGV